MGSMGALNDNMINDTTLVETSTPFDRQECYLPAPTAQCHASNLLILDDGDILCAWFGGSQEGKPDISIYLARLTKGSKTWSSARKVTFDSTRSEQNPVLFQKSADELWLLYTSQNAGDQDSAVVKKQVSIDRGESWSEPQVLFGEPGTFIRQPVVRLSNDGLVIPTFKCRTEPGTRWIGNDDISAVRHSSDQGNTWTEIDIPSSFGAVHMQINRLQNGSYIGLFRSRWADNIYSSKSNDGLNWMPPKALDLPNPNSGICFSVLPSGRLLTVYNHSSRANATARREGLYDEIAEVGDIRGNQGHKHGKEAFWGAPRAPLCLAWSDDEGVSWEHRLLEDGDGYCLTNNSEQRLNRELSYPSMAVAEDGTVFVAFTYWRQRIKFVQIAAETVAC
jgi:predicted neuraminidase